MGWYSFFCRMGGGFRVWPEGKLPKVCLTRVGSVEHHFQAFCWSSWCRVNFSRREQVKCLFIPEKVLTTDQSLLTERK